MNINTAGKLAASILSIMALCVAVVGFMDQRHAKAQDLKDLTVLIKQDQRAGYEEKLDEVEAQIVKLRAKTRTPEENIELESLQLKRERYLRILEELRK